MVWFRSLAIAIIYLSITTATGASVRAQADSQSDHSRLMEVSLTMTVDRLTVGQKPTPTLKIKNISNRKMAYPLPLHAYRLHVEGERGGPPMTEFNRHLHGEFRGGDGPDLKEDPFVVGEMLPNESRDAECDLTRYYDLSAPGRYTAFFEIEDMSSGVWLRTNTVTFWVEAPPR